MTIPCFFKLFFDDLIFNSVGETLDDMTIQLNTLNKQYDTYYSLIVNHILTPLQ